MPPASNATPGFSPQIADAIERPTPNEPTRITRRALPPGLPAGERLRSAIYDLLGLAAPARPAPRRAAGEPLAERRDVASFAVYAEAIEDTSPEPVIVLGRHLAAADRGTGGKGGVRFLLAPADEPDRLLAEAAEIVVGRAAAGNADAEAACTNLLRLFCRGGHRARRPCAESARPRAAGPAAQDLAFKAALEAFVPAINSQHVNHDTTLVAKAEASYGGVTIQNVFGSVHGNATVVGSPTPDERR